MRFATIFEDRHQYRSRAALGRVELRCARWWEHAEPIPDIGKREVAIGGIETGPGRRPTGADAGWARNLLPAASVAHVRLPARPLDPASLGHRGQTTDRQG